MHWAARIVRQQYHFGFVDYDVLNPLTLHPLVGGDKDEPSFGCNLNYLTIGDFLFLRRSVS